MSFEFGQDDAKSIGGFLKSVRLQKELAIEEIAESLKIHSRFLKAIEEDRYDDLPGPVYKDLFLKAYSNYLGVDLEETLLRLPEQPPEPEGEDEEQQQEDKKPAKSEQEGQIRKNIHQDTRKDTRKDIRKMPTASAGGIKRTWTHLLILTVLAVIIVAVLVLVLKFGGVVSDSSTPTDEPATKTQEQPVVMPETLLEVDTAVVMEERIKIRIESSDSCYAKIFTDGDSLGEFIVMPDDPVFCSMQDSIRIKFGAPGVAKVWAEDSLPLRLWPRDEYGVIWRSITRENYLDFVDSTLLLESW